MSRLPIVAERVPSKTVNQWTANTEVIANHNWPKFYERDKHDRKSNNA